MRKEEDMYEYEITLKKNGRIERGVYKLSLNELEEAMEKAMAKAWAEASCFRKKLKENGAKAVRIQTDRCGQNWVITVWEVKCPPVVVWTASGHVERVEEESNIAKNIAKMVHPQRRR